MATQRNAQIILENDILNYIFFSWILMITFSSWLHPPPLQDTTNYSPVHEIQFGTYGSFNGFKN